MKPLPLTLLSVLFVIAACASSTQQPQRSEITRISVATGGCYGECPFWAIDIDSSLNLKYYGGEHADPQGFHTGTIDRATWNEYTWRFDSLGHTTYREPTMNVADAMFFDLIIERPDSSYRYAIAATHIPETESAGATRRDRMLGILYDLMHVHQDLQLMQADTLDFPTGVPYPPKYSKADTIHFHVIEPNEE